jgi:hypothetical protein
VKKNLPAYRYELFIKVLEQRVAAVQKEIEQLRGMERLYNIVKDTMEEARLPQEQDISVSSSYIFVHVTAGPADRLDSFAPVVKALGERLCAADLRNDPEPAVSMGGHAPSVAYVWNIDGFSKTIYLTVHIPKEGLPDVEVTEMDRVTTERQYVLKRIEPPTYTSPQFPVAAGPEAGLVAALDPEVPF